MDFILDSGEVRYGGGGGGLSVTFRAITRGYKCICYGSFIIFPSFLVTVWLLCGVRFRAQCVRAYRLLLKKFND